MREETQPCRVMAEEQANVQLPHPILFASKIFYFGYAQPQTIAIYFIDEADGLCFTCQQLLKRININTVVAALKESDSKTVSARLRKESKQEYSLMIRVEEEFLQPIQEVLMFRGKKLSKQQKKQLATKKTGKEWMQKSEKQIVESIGYCYKSGMMKSTDGSISLLLPLPYSTTLYSFDLFFKNLQDSKVFLEFFYIKGQDTRVIQVMPKEGLFVMGQMQTCIVVQKKGFKEIMMKVAGQFDEVKYIIKLEKVEQSSNGDRKKLKKQVIIGALLAILFAISLMLLPGDGPSIASTLQT